MKRFLSFFLLLLSLINCSNKRKAPIEEATKALHRRDYSTVITMLHPYIKYSNPQVFYLMGKAYLGSKNLYEANKFLDSLAKMDTLYTDSIGIAYLKRGIELARLGERTTALEMLSKGEHFISDSSIYKKGYKAEADIYKYNGEYTKAIKYFNASLKFETDSLSRVELYTNLMKTYEEMGRWDLAYNTGFRAMREKFYFIQTDMARDGVEYLKDLMRRGKVDSAEMIIQIIDPLQFPTRLKPEYLLLKGDFFMKSGDLSSALEAYQTILTLTPRPPQSIIMNAKKRIKMVGE